MVGLEVEVSERDVISQDLRGRECHLKVIDVIGIRRNKHWRRGMTNDSYRYL